jgi:hypothetical protein
MIDLERLKVRRELAKGLVTSYCLENGIELKEKKLKSGMTYVILDDKKFHSLVEQNAWVFALSFLELDLRAKFNYLTSGKE